MLTARGSWLLLTVLVLAGLDGVSKPALAVRQGK